MKDPKERFSDRVNDYKKYRPGYTKELIEYLVSFSSLKSDSAIADIGSGTGIFSKMLLDEGYTVYAVEPNGPMRTQAENDLKGYKKFISIDGAAEDTKLEAGSIDLITACQSFHWFDKGKTKTEFKRILKNNGFVALIWNERKNTSPFLLEYEKLLNTIPDYVKSGHKNIKEGDLAGFFVRGNIELNYFSNSQLLNLEGLKGRLSSSSYAPKEGEDRYDEVFSRLEELFNTYNENGLITFDYKTILIIGNIS